MSEIVYEVLTEFVFDVRGAIENSSMLRGAVDDISSAADGALLSLHKLGEFASHGLGLNLSVMGVLTGAFASFDHFRKTQVSFANIIASNMAHLTGNIETFNDKLDISRGIMKDVAKIAREYSLDESAMMATTKTLAAFLTPAGLSGKNMGNAVDMARMFEKSAPMLGIDTSQAQGELIRAISGQASMGDTLFRRLATEAPDVMGRYGGMRQGMMAAGFGTGAGGTVGLGMGHGQLNAVGGSGMSWGGMHHGGGAQLFNMLPMAQRFDLLNRAMAKFSNNAEVNAANAELLSSKLRVLKNEFIGYDGVLIPLGEVLSNVVRPILVKIIDFVNTYARPALEKFADALKKAFENPERIYATIRQLQAARSNWQEAIHLQHMLGEAMFALWIIRIPVVAGMLRGVGSAFLGLLISLPRVAAFIASFGEMGVVMRVLSLGFTAVRFVFSGLIFVLNRFLLPLAVFFGMLQLISRAKGYAEAADAKALAAEGGKLGHVAVGMGKAFYKIVAPLEFMFDSVARMIAPIFEWNKYLGFAGRHMWKIVEVTDALGTIVLRAVAGLIGLGAVVDNVVMGLIERVIHTFDAIADGLAQLGLKFFDVFEKVKSGDLAGAITAAGKPIVETPMAPNQYDISGKGNMAVFKFAALDTIKDFDIWQKKKDKDEKTVRNHVTNIGAVNIRQDFKENMEPDRIARSLVSVLRDVAVNPTQAAGRSFSGALRR